jgi:hypothetical protein
MPTKSKSKISATTAKNKTTRTKAGNAVVPRTPKLDVANWIRERIRAGRFVPGQRLVEADIMREVATSRSRVREALQRLATEGVAPVWFLKVWRRGIVLYTLRMN